jgi:hypothetical protein
VTGNCPWHSLIYLSCEGHEIKTAAIPNRQKLMVKYLLTPIICLTLSIISIAQPTSVFLRGRIYNLSWFDEFSGSRVDSTRWDFRRDSKALSTQQAKNNVQENGILRQFLKKETANGKSYTGGGLISKDTLHYGYYETMIKTPPKKGWHSGFWLMKQDGTGGTGVARASLEIDILENDSENLNSFTCLHKKYNPVQNLGIKTYNTAQLNTKFVKVGCLYEPDSITYFYDDKQVDKRFIGNLISGKVNIWLTSIGYTSPINESVLPSTFEVDYIRFYQQNVPAQTASTLLPTADAMVQNGINASTNFGTSAQLGTQLTGSLDTKESLLRFDLSSIRNYIGSAKLRVYGNGNTISGPNPIGKVNALDPFQNWTETGVNWNNKPSETGGVLSDQTSIGTNPKYYEFDITPHIINQKEVAMRNIINLKLSQMSGSEALADFLSKEAGNNPPQLVITPLQLVPGIIEQLKDTTWMKDSLLVFSPKIKTIRTTYYQWKKNGIAIPGATSATLNFASLQPFDAGQYSLRISYGVGFDTVETRQATITVQMTNLKPTAIMSFPTLTTTYGMGETLNLVGSGTDPETGNLKNPDMRWVSRYYRNGSIVSTSQIGAGFNLAYKIPTTTETTNSVFYRIFLIARDPQGARDTVWRDIVPRIQNVAVQTNPAGYQVLVNGTTQTTPFNLNTIEGNSLTLGVPDPQGIYVFQSWSQGGAQSQNFIIPGTSSTVTANLTNGNIAIRNTVADAYVVGSSTTNFGTQNVIGSKFNATSSQVRESYLRFDLTNLPGSLLNARLRLYGGLSDNTNPSVRVNVRQVISSASWEENTINWNNKPGTISTVLSSTDCIGMNKVYYEWDLTSFLQSQLALGLSTVNLHLSSPDETASRVDFNSKEAGSFLPELRLALTDGPPIVTQHPLSLTVCEGANAIFSSTVSALPSATVQWQMSTNSGGPWSNIAGASQSGLSLSPNFADNGKWYRAVWTNSLGVVNSNAALLTVIQKPNASIQASGPVSFCQGGTVTLSALPFLPPPSGPITIIADRTSASDAISILPVGSSTPNGEEVFRAIDNNTNTKYLNNVAYSGGNGNSGMEINLSFGQAIITGISISSANDSPDRDPKSYALSGSNDGIAWFAISNGALPTFTARFQKQTVTFSNNKAYSRYRIVFPTIVSNGSATLQLSELELLETSLSTPQFTYSWSTGATTSTIPVSSSANISVIVTDIFGCSNQASQRITVSPNPQIFNVSGGGSYCSSPGSGVPVQLSGSETGVNYQYWLTAGDSISTLSGSGSSLTLNDITGNGTVYVKAKNTVTGCQATMNGSASISVETGTTWYQDSDGDGFGALLSTSLACTQPMGFVTNSTDCDDNNSNVNPSKTEICGNGIDDNCDGQTDENCALYTFYQDSDLDGFGNLSSFLSSNNPTVPNGYVTNSTDCDDNNAAINSPLTFFVDADLDGFGSSTTALLCTTTAPAGYSTNNTDCDDNNSTINSPVTYFVDADGDGFGSTTTAMLCSTIAPVGYSTNNTDCNDNNSNVNPSKTEICGNGVDDNCNGQNDENCAIFTFFQDSDSDGFGNLNMILTSNNPAVPNGYVTNSTDCNDGNSAINPAATEICNGVDDNCNGFTDENQSIGNTSAISGQTTVCQGLNNQIFTIDAVEGANSYTWTLPSGASGNSTTTSISVSFSNQFMGGSICVRAIGTCAQSPETCVSLNFLSNIPNNPGSISGQFLDLPVGSSQTYSVSSVIGAQSYNWVVPANASISDGQGTNSITVNFATGFQSGVISVTASNCVGSSPSSGLNLISNLVSQTPIVNNQPQSQQLALGANVSFSVGVTGVLPVFYQWKKGSNSIPGEIGSSLSLLNIQNSDLDVYSVMVSYGPGFPILESSPAVLSLLVNQKPIASLTSPVLNSRYAMGETISFSGSANDPETGNLAPSSLEWRFQYFRNGLLASTTNQANGANGSYTIPKTTETSTNVFYRILLIATDVQGLKDTASRDILPRIRTLTIATQPIGLQLLFNAQTLVSPINQTLIEGSAFSVSAPGPQGSNQFSYWSQGGANAQTITIPASNLNLTAFFAQPASFTLNPVADSYIQSGSGAALNFGLLNTLIVKASTDPLWVRESVIRFDISGISGNLLNARLRIFGGLSDNNNSFVTVEVKENTTNWTETGVNWNNRPSHLNPIIATQNISGTSKKTYEWELSTYILAQRALGRNTIDLKLVSPVATASRVDFNSKEAASNRPELVITAIAGAPVISSQPQSLQVLTGGNAVFAVVASGSQSLVYQWKKDGFNISGANGASYTISNVSIGDAGAYSVEVSYGSGTLSTISSSATLTISQPNSKPTASISTPILNSTFGGGQLISFSGSGTDPETGNLAGTALQWYIQYIRNGVISLAMSNQTGASGSFTVPVQIETSTNVSYKIFLIATDPAGLRDTVSRIISPRIFNLTLLSNPAGLQVVIDGTTLNSPATVSCVEGMQRNIGVSSSQAGLVFGSWSQGGVQNQTISMPAANTTYTANFVSAASVTFTSTADSYVQSGTSANLNFGTTISMATKASTDPLWVRETLVRFDISSFSGSVASAKLRLFCGLSDNWNPSVQIDVKEIPLANTWTETGVTWNNRPAELSPVLASQTIAGTTRKTYEWDLSNYIMAQRALGRNIIDLKLVSPVATASRVDFNSKEAASNRPELVITAIAGAPVISSQPQSLQVLTGGNAVFAVVASGSQSLVYQWKKDGFNISGANGASYTISNVSSGDAGAYSVEVSYGSGTLSTISNSATLTISQPNSKPTASISTPILNSTFGGGQLISFSGSGTDPETGNLPGTALQWYIQYIRNGVSSMAMSNQTGASGSFTVPVQIETSTNVSYRIFLIAIDPAGLRDTVSRIISPRIFNLTLLSNPAGLQVVIDGTTMNSPATVSCVEGMLRNIGVSSSQGGLVFGSWSQGGAQNQTISMPSANTTYTANFIPASSVTFTSTADSYVQSGTSANLNFGTTISMATKASTDPLWVRETLVRFDISSFSGSVASAKLRLFCGLSDNWNPSVQVDVKEIPPANTWTETGVTWNNRPAELSPVLATLPVVGFAKKYYEWDLTSFILAQRALGRTSINLKIICPVATASRVDINSKEAGVNMPQLVLTSSASLGRLALHNNEVVEELEDLEIAIYPNPAHGKFVLNGLLQNQKNNIRIVDVSGRILHNEVIEGLVSRDFDISAFKAGVYFIKMETENQSIFKRLIVR